MLLKGFEERYQRLKFLLDKSVIYTGVLKQHMEGAKVKAASPATLKKDKRKPTNKRLRIESEDEAPSKRTRVLDSKTQAEFSEKSSEKLKQPALITGATLKDYQLEGVEWMISLDQNGISGILGMFKPSIFLSL